MDTEVLIVGAGPTGLTLAIDLGLRGVRTMIVEQKEAPQFLPKMERCNARTMEIYRRMGIAERVRAAGLPAWVPMDVFIVPRLLIRRSCILPTRRSQAKREIAASRIAACRSSPTSPQYTLERCCDPLRNSLRRLGRCAGCEPLSFAQDQVGIKGRSRRAAAKQRVNAFYLSWVAMAARAWCARSWVLRCEARAISWRCASALPLRRELYERIPIGKDAITSPMTARRSSSFRIDQTFHVAFRGQALRYMAQSSAPSACRSLRDAVCREWKQNLLLADRYGEGRVFLAGDAVHLMILTGASA
jgi:2-polyprenyl-6-methoxyphenol hydroxylase-like FAD-dependent oxidoreductase